MTKTIFLTGLGTLAILSMILLPYAPQAEADDTVCSGTLTEAGGPYDNVIVNSGDSCEVEDETIINGNFEAHGAVDIIIAGSFSTTVTIDGNIQISESTGKTTVFRTNVGGSIQVEKSAAPTSPISITENTVGQDIQVSDNLVRTISIDRNTFNSGNILVLKNTQIPSGGLISVGFNSSPENIIVQENSLTSDTTVSLVIQRNTVKGDIIVQSNTLISEKRSFNSVGLIVRSNTFSSGNIQVQSNSVIASSSGSSATALAQITVRANGIGGSPQNIIVQENSLTTNTVNDQLGLTRSLPRFLVDDNDVEENIKVQKNTVNANGVDSRNILALMAVSGNEFSHGNLQVQENFSNASGTGADAVIEIELNGSISPAQNIEVQKNTASAPDIEQIDVLRNEATENFQCSENTPAPTGSLNVGNLEGQCATLI